MHRIHPGKWLAKAVRWELLGLGRVLNVEEEEGRALAPGLKADACRVPIVERDTLLSPPPLPTAGAV